MNLRSCIILQGLKQLHTHTNLIMSLKIDKNKSLIQNGFLTKTMGLACLMWKRLEPVLDERRKRNLARGRGREARASLIQRAEPTRRKLGPGKQQSPGRDSQLSRQSL